MRTTASTNDDDDGADDADDNDYDDDDEDDDGDDGTRARAQDDAVFGDDTDVGDEIKLTRAMKVMRECAREDIPAE